MCVPRDANSRRLVDAETAVGSRPRRGGAIRGCVNFISKSKWHSVVFWKFWTFDPRPVYGICKNYVCNLMVFLKCVMVSHQWVQLCHIANVIVVTWRWKTSNDLILYILVQYHNLLMICPPAQILMKSRKPNYTHQDESREGIDQMIMRPQHSSSWHVKDNHT